MQFRTRQAARAALTFWLLVFASFAVAQGASLQGTNHLSMSDVDDIAALCGGDPLEGKPLYEQSCAACHTLDKGDAHLQGPNLYGFFDAPAAQAEGYDYSSALRMAAQNGLVWTRATTRPFMREPQAEMPGTTHPFLPELQSEAYLVNLMTYVRVVTTPPPPAVEDVVVPPEVLAMEGDVPYGEYLASECVSCHVTGAASANGVPQIDTLSREEMILALFQYRVGARANETMGNLARRLADEEIAALAAYFSQLN